MLTQQPLEGVVSVALDPGIGSKQDITTSLVPCVLLTETIRTGYATASEPTIRPLASYFQVLSLAKSILAFIGLHLKHHHYASSYAPLLSLLKSGALQG